MLRLPTQILDKITYSDDYNLGGFYIFVCEYEPGSEDEAEIIAHGLDPTFLGLQLSGLTYSKKLQGSKNEEIGRELARQEVML